MTLEPLGADERTVDVLVIGAGIIGIAIALRIAQSGRAVTVIDREGVAAQASRGNAGAFAVSDILPLASPRILRQVPRWLADPLGPLALRATYLPTIVPWLWQFWRASRPERYRAGIAAQAALNALATSETPRMLADIGATDMLREDGALELYESESELHDAGAAWQARAAHGIEFTHLRGIAAIAELQPGLSPALVAGTFIPQWKTISDPLVLVQRLARDVERRGGRLRLATARTLAPATDHVRVDVADGPPIAARRVVVAAGAWSHQLARTLGERIPLETERGYNTTLPVGAFDLRRQLTFGAHGFVVTPLACGIRVGGAVELAGLAAPPDFRRSEALLGKAKRFMPSLATDGGTQWMGFRPSLPDSLPAIGPSTREPRVVYAFGHGHLGLTQSAATARLVGDLIAGESTPIDLAPFRPLRFGSGSDRH